MARWIRRSLFACLLLVVLYAATWLVLSFRSGMLVERELEALRSRGEPIRLEEMAPPDVSDEANAALPFRKAMAALRAETEEEATARERLTEDPFDADGETVSLVEGWVAANAATLSHVEEAARRPVCRFDAGPDAELVYVLPLTSCGRLLVGRALLAARADRLEDALRDLACALRLARGLGTDPVLIELVVRMGTEKAVLEGLEAVLSRSSPSSTAGDELRKALERAADPEAHRRAILGERCFGIASFQAEPGDPRFHAPERGFLYRLVPGPARRFDQARYLRLMSRAIELSQRPWGEAAGDWDDLIAEALDEPWYGGATSFAVGGTAEFWATGVAHRARLVMAAQSIGKGPVQTDPFTGRPFEVSTTPDGLRTVRSPGPDRKSAGDDITWTWRRAE